MRLSRLILAGLAAALPLAATSAPAQTLVRGRLLDAGSGGAISQATVVISANRGRWQQATVTDSTGGFSFADVAAGPYRLRATRIGYREAVGELGLAADSVIDLELRMAGSAVVLQPVTVVTRSERRVSPVLRGFYTRMQHGSGRFITREEIERRHANHVTDLLRNIPNLRPSAARQGTTLSNSSNSDRCTVVYFVDGQQVNRPSMNSRGGPVSDISIDDYVNAAEVEGIEIYRGESDTPAEFATRWVQCGTVVIWTRRGHG